MSGKGRHEIPAETRASQTQATEPDSSVWVSANAGSGKTYVLTRRVIRLLLDGVEPSRILCLTFTKAAAANMQNRVFAELSAWVSLDDAELAGRLQDITGQVSGREALAPARRLFARAVETPGGLRIQTIHAFCEQLLHLFPLEANVAAGFSVIDEAEAQALMDRAIAAAIRDALAAPDTPLGMALTAVAAGTAFHELPRILAAAVAAIRETPTSARANEEALRAAFGLSDDEGTEAIDQAMVTAGIAAAEWPAIVTLLARGSSNDQAAGRRLAAAVAATAPAAKASAYLRLFLTDKDQLRKAIVTKAVSGPEPVLAARLAAEGARLLGLLERRRAAAAVEQTSALLHLAGAVHAFIEAEKHRRGLLDFDDLIARTLALLQRADAAWVLFKLDGGIDHLLVDEAQDTSPRQWTILKALTGDFFTGDSAVRRNRTVFAVGDEKQSIYSFQGADPREFDAAMLHFKAQVVRAQRNFVPVKLKLSFRSTADVLGAVDAVFADPGRRKGLSNSDDVATVHGSVRGDAPGLVEIWPEIAAAADDDDAKSDEGVDAPLPTAPPVLLARRIAARVALWLRAGTMLEGEGRPIRAGDIMILVRRRNAFFEAVIRALKRVGVPVAGADRLKLMAHIAVMDLVALGRAMLLPEDDLTLAAVLKSPLLGLDDDDLIALAPQRAGSLRAALAASPVQAHRAASQKLARWQALAAINDAFAFYAAILGPEGGRQALLARLGPDAAEAIDVFLADAQAHAAKAPPTLRGFLDRIVAEDRTVRRDMDAAGDSVRVMTAHAAKGLEAPVVFLADTFSHPMPQHDSRLMRLGEGPRAPLVWATSASDDCAPVAAERLRLREAAWDEYRRLLYVGMTRAADRLYIAGYRGKREVGQPVWYKAICEALTSGEAGELLRTVPAEDGEGEVLQWRRNAAPPLAVVPATPDAPQVREALPSWLWQPAPPEPGFPGAAAASALLPAPSGGPGLMGAGAQARRRGVLLHRLFEAVPAIPPAGRKQAAMALLRRERAGGQAESLADQALAVMADPRFAALFAPGSRAEVAVTGPVALPDGRVVRLEARVDRLVVTPDSVLVADFKTGMPPANPSAPSPGVLAQLAAYRALLAPLYPGRPVRCLVLWTAIPRLVEISGAQLDEALHLVAAVRDITVS